MNKCLTVLMLLTLTRVVSAQPSPSEDMTLAKQYRLDFAVPDLPAFNLLGTQPDQILRPSSLRELALLASGFSTAHEFFLPRSLALEIAPFMLARTNQLTLQDYDSNRIPYSLRLSLGITRTEAETVTTKLAGGARLTLLDDGDLKNDLGYRRRLGVLLGDLVSLKDSFGQEFLARTGDSMKGVLNDTLKWAAREKYIEARVGQGFEKHFQELKQDYKARNWSKQKWDIALAALWTTPESLARDARFNRAAFWTTYGLPLGDGGQLLIGGNASYYSDSVSYFTGAVSSRAYFGVNRAKGFLELQGRGSSLTKSLDFTGSLGAEFNLTDGLWANLNAGVEYADVGKPGQHTRLISQLELRFATPERFELF